MVRHYQWYDPVLIKRIRISLTILTWVVWGMIIFIQHERILQLMKSIF